VFLKSFNVETSNATAPLHTHTLTFCQKALNSEILAKI
jgi:hypothetical protein